MLQSFASLQTRRLFRAPNYTSAFGLWTGLRLLFEIERRFESCSAVLRSYRVPGYQTPIWLRDTIADHSFFWQCIVVRQYAVEAFPQARRLMAEYESALLQGDIPVILDAGGNIGLAAIWFARAFPKSVVISIEPEQRNFALLTRNVAPLGQRVVPVFGALTERRKRLSIVNPAAGSGAFRVQESFDCTSNDLLGYTVDELVARVRNRVLLIAKIDIEGSQKQLFSNNIG